MIELNSINKVDRVFITTSIIFNIAVSMLYVAVKQNAEWVVQIAGIISVLTIIGKSQESKAKMLRKLKQKGINILYLK